MAVFRDKLIIANITSGQMDCLILFDRFPVSDDHFTPK